MNLDQLRDELARVDREMFELVARRLELASRIGSVKRAEGAATRDYGQEKAVLERAEQAARELGLSPQLAEQLVLLLIRSSLTVQERHQIAAESGGDGRRALVIGGAGRMGGWFVRFLASQGFEIEIADPAGAVAGFRHRARLGHGELGHDVIVVAAPLSASNEILHELAAHKPPGLVFDIGSLKGPLRSGLYGLIDAGVTATSIHPMFGPDTELLSGRHVVFVDVGCPRATTEAREMFASTMATLVSMELEHHDRVIAFVLGLSHALNIAFFTALTRSGEAAPKLAELSSTTFDAQLSVARAVAGDNPSLYYEIQSLNDYGPHAVTALLEAVEQLRSVLREGDEAAFVELMDRGRAYLAERG